MLNSVNITGPPENPSGAINEDVVTITMDPNTDLIAAPTVIINGEIVDDPTFDGTDYYTATKIISDADPEGPILFSIDFTSADNIPGQTVLETTNNSKVIVDRIGAANYNTNDIFTVGGNEITHIWNSTNTSLDVTLTLPPDTAITDFNVLNDVFHETIHSLFFKLSLIHI